MTNLSENAFRFLESLQRFDLALLIANCAVAVEERRGFHIDDAWFGNAVGEEVVVTAPPPVDEALRSLPSEDRTRIAQAVASGVPTSPLTDDIRVQPDSTSRASDAASLVAELIIQRELMISVATGGPRIQEVNDYYRAREARIREWLPANVGYSNPHADLWDWYRHWDANFPHYRERRRYVREIFAPPIDNVAMRPSLSIAQREETGWERVDRALAKARTQLERASAEEDFQAIGLICREVIISLAQAVFDPEEHPTLDGIEASSTDANRMLEAYVAKVFPGSGNKEVRAHARASLALALHLQHRRTATRRLAALCVEATASTAAVVSLIARSE